MGIPTIPKEIRVITVKYSLLQFFYYFNFFWLIQNVYFLNNGISFKELSILLGTWSLSIIVLEIPSGILADKLGNKPVIIIGKLGFLMGILSFVFLRSFIGFLVGMIFWGIHESFISGALESLVYEDIKFNSNKKLYKRVLSIATVSREVGLGFGVLIAGFVTQLNINYNLIASILIAVVGFLISLKLPNRKSSIEPMEITTVKFFKKSLHLINENMSLKNIILFDICVLISYGVISEYFIVSLKALNLDYIVIGFMAFFEMIFFSIGATISHKIQKHNYSKLYVILSVIMAGGILLITTKSLYIVLAAWMLLRIVKAVSEITANSDWQEKILSEDRATTTSIKSFFGNIIYIPLAFVFGALADSIGLFNAFYLIAFVAASFIFIKPILLYKKRSVR